MLERLQKVVARAGVASRRAAEELIVKGRVRVNGRVVTELGTRVDPRADRVEVDGRRLVSEAPVYLVLNKPRAVVSTLSDPEGRPTIRDLVGPGHGRVFPVGRLDYHTSGVLLLTNDGEFMDGLLHPRRDVPKTYVVKLNGRIDEPDRVRWEKGVQLEDGMTRPAVVRLLRDESGKSWLEVTLMEGRNQQIRRTAEALGFNVMRLSRIVFAGITADGLRPGQLRPLSVDELLELREKYGVPRKLPPKDVAPPSPARPVRPRRPSQGARSTGPHGAGRPRAKSRK